MTQHQQHSSQQGGSGNFANDPDRAREAGSKGGQHSHDHDGNKAHQQHSPQRGGSGNFANDPDRAREAGSKGGQHSHNKDSEQEGRGTEESQGEEE